MDLSDRCCSPAYRRRTRQCYGAFSNRVLRRSNLLCDMYFLLLAWQFADENTVAELGSPQRRGVLTSCSQITLKPNVVARDQDVLINPPMLYTKRCPGITRRTTNLLDTKNLPRKNLFSTIVLHTLGKRKVLVGPQCWPQSH